jgi:hypothetical protein
MIGFKKLDVAPQVVGPIISGLFSNSSLLTAPKIDELLALKPTFIQVSLDAATPGIHHLVHGWAVHQGVKKCTVQSSGHLFCLS